MTKQFFEPAEIFRLAKIGHGKHFMITRFSNGPYVTQALHYDGEWRSIEEGSQATAETTFSDSTETLKVEQLGKISDCDRYMVTRTVCGRLQALQVAGGWVDREPGFIADRSEIFTTKSGWRS